MENIWQFRLWVHFHFYWLLFKHLNLLSSIQLAPVSQIPIQWLWVKGPFWRCRWNYCQNQKQIARRILPRWNCCCDLQREARRSSKVWSLWKLSWAAASTCTPIWGENHPIHKTSRNGTRERLDSPLVEDCLGWLYNAVTTHCPTLKALGRMVSKASAAACFHFDGPTLFVSPDMRVPEFPVNTLTCCFCSTVIYYVWNTIQLLGYLKSGDWRLHFF